MFEVIFSIENAVFDASIFQKMCDIHIWCHFLRKFQGLNGKSFHHIQFVTILTKIIWIFSFVKLPLQKNLNFRDILELIQWDVLWDADPSVQDYTKPTCMRTEENRKVSFFQKLSFYFSIYIHPEICDD